MRSLSAPSSGSGTAGIAGRGAGIVVPASGLSLQVQPRGLLRCTRVQVTRGGSCCHRLSWALMRSCPRPELRLLLFLKDVAGATEQPPFPLGSEGSWKEQRHACRRVFRSWGRTDGITFPAEGGRLGAGQQLVEELEAPSCRAGMSNPFQAPDWIQTSGLYLHCPSLALLPIGVQGPRILQQAALQRPCPAASAMPDGTVLWTDSSP